MIITRFSLNNKTTVLFFLFIIFLGGITAYFKLGKLEDPDFTIKTAAIITPYPGASPHQVEQEVTRKIEEAVQSARQVEFIRSESRAGYSLVYVDLYESINPKDLEQLWDILRRKVEKVQQDMPEGTLPSQVMDDYGDVFGIFLALTGDGLELSELEKYAKYIKRELLLVKDVEKINLYGIHDEVINIEIDQPKVANLGINPLAIVNSVREQNHILLSGDLETSSKRIRIAHEGSFTSLAEIENLIIQLSSKTQIRLKDIASVKREYKNPPDSLVRFRGEPAIGIGISAKKDANVVEMGDALKKRMDELLEDLPAGTRINGVYYQSEFVKHSIKQFMTNLMQSVGIVVLVLLISMGLRAGIIIASNLILSILATFIVMIAIGINLQQISLAALIIVMGMIVDNAIVVAEGTQTMYQKGMKRFDAIITPASQTGIPLLGATIIAILAFMPIYLAPSGTGEFVGSLSIVVGISLLISWILAMSQTPVFSFYLLKTSEKEQKKDPNSKLIYRIYRPLLYFALRNRIATVAFMILLLFSGIAGFENVSQNFFPDSDKTQFFVDYRRPEGTKITSVSNDIKKFEAYLKSRNDLSDFTSCIGESAPRFASALTPESPNPSFAQVVINVRDYRKIDQIINEIDDWFSINLPQGNPHPWKYVSGPKPDYRIEARITGRDPKKLREIAEKIKGIMAQNKKAKYITDDWKERVMALNFDYSQLQAKKAGIERSHISLAALAATDGVPVSNFREADKLIPVNFKYSDITPEKLEGLPVWGNLSNSVPLAQVVNSTDIKFEDPVIRRYGRKRVIRAQCDPAQGVTADTLLSEIRPIVEKLKLPKGYEIEWEGEHELSTKDKKNTDKYLPLCLLLMVLILVSLFNSVKQPLIIILTIPFAIIGITPGLLIMNQPFGFLSILGAYSLTGMLIKNAVVLIDEINLNLDKGEKPMDAIKNACENRMRPVLLASLTTIFGMTPLLTDALFAAMATTIMFGLFVATILILIIVPVLYSLFYNIKPAKSGK